MGVKIKTIVFNYDEAGNITGADVEYEVKVISQQADIKSNVIQGKITIEDTQIGGAQLWTISDRIYRSLTCGM